MNVLAIIPARGGSKRVPRKNLRLLGGKPLVCWAIDAARAARGISELVLSSDDEEILDLARAVSPSLALRRPASLSGDLSPAIDYVQHALTEVEKGTRKFEAVVIVQPSSPFTTGADIDATID